MEKEIVVCVASVLVQRAFSNSGRGWSESKKKYRRSTTLRLVDFFALAPMRKNLFAKEAEKVCSTEEGDSGRSKAHRNPSVIGCCMIALEAVRASTRTKGAELEIRRSRFQVLLCRPLC